MSWNFIVLYLNLKVESPNRIHIYYKSIERYNGAPKMFCILQSKLKINWKSFHMVFSLFDLLNYTHKICARLFDKQHTLLVLAFPIFKKTKFYFTKRFSIIINSSPYFQFFFSLRSLLLFLFLLWEKCFQERREWILLTKKTSKNTCLQRLSQYRQINPSTIEAVSENYISTRKENEHKAVAVIVDFFRFVSFALI